MADSTTKQVPNPTGKGGFGDNPQNRHNGAWKKADTPRYKLEQMMKLSEEELIAVASDKDAPYFERTLAFAMAQKDWKTMKEMIAEVYGTPRQSVDVTSGGKEIKTVVEIIDARDKGTDT